MPAEPGTHPSASGRRPLSGFFFWLTLLSGGVLTGFMATSHFIFGDIFLKTPNDDSRVKEISRTFSFSRGSPNLHLLKSGWANPEGWGVWSNGDTAKLEIPLATTQPENELLSAEIQFDAAAYLKGPRRQLRVIVSAAGKTLDSWTFRKKGAAKQRFGFKITDRKILDNHLIALTFDIKTPVSPAELGLGPDKRKLGIGLISGSIILSEIQNVIIQE